MDRKSFLAAALLTAGVATAARADTYTYTYTGNDFTSVSSPFTTADRVTGSFTTAAPLPGGLHIALIQPLSFSFNDGVDTITNMDTFTNQFFLITTNGSGAITEWEINLDSNSSNTPEIDTRSLLSVATDDAESGTDIARFPSNNFDDPGTWSETVNVPAAVTPEPPSIVLLATGLLGAAAALRKRTD